MKQLHRAPDSSIATSQIRGLSTKTTGTNITFMPIDLFVFANLTIAYHSTMIGLFCRI
jgi:hypothetical protein